MILEDFKKMKQGEPFIHKNGKYEFLSIYKEWVVGGTGELVATFHLSELQHCTLPEKPKKTVKLYAYISTDGFLVRYDREAIVYKHRVPSQDMEVEV